MKPTILPSAGSLSPLAALLCGLGSFTLSTPGTAQEGQPTVTRVRLFDHMAEARWSGIPSADEANDPPTKTATWDFTDSSPDGLWYGRNEGRKVNWETEFGGIEPEGGLSGGHLRLGPNVPEDNSRAVILVPSSGLTRVHIQGRVRLVNNPLGDDSTLVECMRLVEHRGLVSDPTVRQRFRRSGYPTRVSRRHHPSGWDTFEHTFITSSTTKCLELQLLHRSGESGDSLTLFDDIQVEQTALTQREVIDHISDNYKPRDGNEQQTPWRLRVDLMGEVRDAVLIPPPASIAIPVQIPGIESQPQLRFHFGMTREAQRAEGDGAHLEIVFFHESGSSTPLGRVSIDPRAERDHRSWLLGKIDLTAVAGQRGHLQFQSQDMDDEPDLLDTLVLATPRIEPQAPTAAPFNLLMIGVDTLRADHLSAFGYERPTTPHLAALADEGVRFSQTRAQAPWTLPSFSSIMTSLYPSVHGAGRGGHDEWTPIDPTSTALAEILSRVGYETQGIVANGLISPKYGLDQGFEGYRFGWNMESAKSDEPKVSAFVREHTATPWMLFWHIMDPHLPYTTDASFREAFTDPEYSGRFKNSRGAYVPFEVLDPRPGRRWFVHEGPPPPPELAEEDRAFVHDYYDAELAEVDAAIGRVLDAIRASGQWDRTMIAFVADHGEGLGDHNHYHHGYTLHDDQVHIPMILRIPGSHEGRTVSRPVAAIDLAPTILGALGLEIPDFFHGVDRLAPDAPSEDAYFIEYPTYDSSAQKAWIQGRFKYLHDPVFHTQALYDLQADPGELTDIASEHPQIVERAKAAMDAFRWEKLQRGRYHLRISGAVGQRLQIQVDTDDLFDANFAARPAPPETDFSLDLDRKHLRMDTTLTKARMEFVFWCRGDKIDINVLLDGKPCKGGLYLGNAEDPERLPTQLQRKSLPIEVADETIGWPAAQEVMLWQERGVDEVLPVLLTPEELETMRALGYAR